MKFKVTVIIPCYNSERTLQRCIDSVINQTLGFNNIELIIYDNNSEDSTKMIIQSYAKEFNNIIPFYSEVNSGFPGTGRNKGIDVASSEYIMFLDSDDEYDLNICEVLYNTINDYNVDLVGCNWNFYGENDGFDKNLNLNWYNGEEIIYFEDIMIWNKIYKKEILKQNNIRFPEKLYSEDVYFNILFFSKSNSFIHIPGYFGYIRHIQKESISRNWDIDGLLSSLMTLEQIFFKTKYINYNYSKCFKNHIEGILGYLIWYRLVNDKIKCIELLNELNKFENEIKFNSHLSSKFLEIANNLILNKKFNICFYYLKLFETIYNNVIINKIYKLIFS